MKWTIEHFKRAIVFIEEQGIKAKVTDSIRDFILTITGSSINIDASRN